MPELPEVQTVVDDLNKKIKGSSIVDFWTDWAKSIKNSVAVFKKKTKNRKIVEIKRRAKNILVYLDDGQVMLIHLKMTGHLLIKIQMSKSKCQNKSKIQMSNKKGNYFDDRVNQYIHHVWFLKGDSNNSNSHSNVSNNKYDKTLEFSDLRKFGKIELFKNEELLLKDKNFAMLGVEPLDKKFDFKKIKQAAKKFVLIYSDNDPLVPLSQGKELKSQLGGKLYVVPRGNHLCEGEGSFRLPIALEEILKI